MCSNEARVQNALTFIDTISSIYNHNWNWNFCHKLGGGKSGHDMIGPNFMTIFIMVVKRI